MVEISPFSALSSQQSNIATDRASIAEDFDTFLTLLTTQLRNQDPTDPLDTNQFTQQLVQFTEVEQTLKQNEHLEQLIKLSASSAITNVVGFLGAEVTLSGKTSELSNGRATWHFNMAEEANNATFTVRDSNGAPVFSTSGSVPQGQNSFVWDGRTDNGTLAPDGSYTLTVTAADGNGTAINVQMESVGIVDGIDFSGEEPLLRVGGRQVSLNDIISVSRPTASPPSS